MLKKPDNLWFRSEIGARGDNNMNMNFSSALLESKFSVQKLFSYYVMKYDSNYRYVGEQHNFWEFVFVKKGKIGVTADNMCYELSENSVVFHKPGEFHSLWSASGTSPEIMIVSFSAEGGFMKNFENKIFSVDERQRGLLNELKLLLDFTVAECQSDGCSHRILINPDADETELQAVKNLIEYILISFHKNNAVNSNKITSYSISTHAEIYAKVLDYLKDNLYGNITIDDICNNINVSKTTLKSVFSKYTGNTIMKYFLLMKFEKAKELLLIGEQIGNISDKLAFSSQNYFCYAFKREFGMTPFEFKKRSEI